MRRFLDYLFAARSYAANKASAIEPETASASPCKPLSPFGLRRYGAVCAIAASR